MCSSQIFSPTAALLAFFAGAATPALAESPFPQWTNVAAGKPVQFNPAPTDPSVSDEGDGRQLTDGGLTSKTPMWYDASATVGWVGPKAVEFTIDLGSVQPIRGLSLHAGAGQAGVEWPTSVHVFVSTDGESFSPIGDVMRVLAKGPPAKEYADFWLATTRLETHGRFVRLVCTPTDKGNGSYFYIDEVEVYRGQDAWLSRPLEGVESPQRWTADWREFSWQDQLSSVPEVERPRRLVMADAGMQPGEAAPPFAAERGTEGVRFSLVGEAGHPRRMSWTTSLARPVSTDACRYAVLTFRAEGIRRVYEAAPLITLQGVSTKTSEHEIVLLESKLPPNDARSHTLVRRLPEGFMLQGMRVGITTEDDAPSLTLERLELLPEVPDVYGANAETDADGMKDGLVAVELSNVFNTSITAWSDAALEKHGAVMDGVRALPTGVVKVSGVPFTIGSSEQNLAAMPQSTPSDEEVEFLGAKVAKRYLNPESRHDTLAIDTDATATEAMLLLAVSAPPVQVLGGQAHTALQLDDIECLSVELTYDRGGPELAFPYSLADQSLHIPSRTLGAYAVAVDPNRRLKRITLHNRQYGPNFAIAAITLNTTPQRMAPALVDTTPPPVTKRLAEPAARPLSIATIGGKLQISNRWYDVGFDLTKGFAIDRLIHRWDESASAIDPTSGLRVRVGDTVYAGSSFASEIVRITDREAVLQLTSRRAELPLLIELTIHADDSPELRFIATATNHGPEPTAFELCLPAIAGLTLGGAEQTRVFFPQYRAVDTGDPIALRSAYGLEYAHEFMSVYSREAGVGLMIRTDNRTQQMADFALRKDDRGVTAGVWFPASYNTLASGTSREYAPVSLIPHAGDWRDSLSAYRDWVRTWYKPVDSQDESYLLNAWDIACYRTSDRINWQDTKTPPFITADRKRFVTDEVFAFEQEHLGHVPDMVHFFNWTHNDAEARNEYGVFGSPLAYAQVGGIDFFRDGIAHIQETWGKPVSLYTLGDRFRASAMPDPAVAQELVAAAWHSQPDNDASAALRASSQPDGIYYPPLGHPKWTDHLIHEIVQMQRDTGCKLVYIDVFAYWSHLRGYNGISPREGDLLVLKQLREQLPDDVAIWSEYPVTDVASQYADATLHYYFLHLNEVFARRYNELERGPGLMKDLPFSLGRYTVPRYKPIALPAYIEASNSPSQVDAIFVNGEALQEDTWRLHHSRARERLNRSYLLKHAFNDCFNADRPNPRVDTAAAGIVANHFPGTSRNVWTLYSGRAKTYEGDVLRVPHREGAVYRDAWNDHDLHPRIDDGIAHIAIRLDPQQPGCVVQDWSK